jgi:dipeptidyl aminopeptidase/acylaminoacyl peptidase
VAAQPAPYGSWWSPLTATAIVEGAATITEVVVDGDDVWWAETRPSERGRTAIMRRRRDGTIIEVTPPTANVRSRVHEYGGGAWWAQDGVLVYTDLGDSALHRLDGRGLVTLAGDDAGRYADGRFTPDGRWYVCVRERHLFYKKPPSNEIVAVATDGSRHVRTVADRADFVASPRPSPDGTQLAWLQWDHPNMPWDGTELWVGALRDGAVEGARRVVGRRDESLLQPEWSPGGELHVISDRSGWWNLYRVDADGALTGVRVGDFEIGGPMWVFGLSAYAFRSDGSVVVDADLRPVLSDPTSIRARGDDVIVAGATWSSETEVVSIAPDGTRTSLRAPRDLGLDATFFPAPEAITFPTGAGDERAHGWFYRPANPTTIGPDGERPPLLVLVHGGPTAAARRSLHLPLRYWTSRGFAVVDVDYRGSTGYGRAYRRALDERWGIADVEDCVAAARYLAARGDVDGDRLLIRGSSAGGYTVLCALTFHDAFAAGASHYGVTDLEALARDTHKFESRYLDRLVGPWPAAKDRYLARSPIHHTDQLHVPMIILQGLDDTVVPPNQAEMMVAALRAKGVPFAYVSFFNEGHGFRKAENIIRALEAELSFYAQLFGFEPADPIEPVLIQGG